MQNNKRVLISIMAVLVLIKFVALPLHEAQQALHQQLSVLSKQLQRAQALLEEKHTLEKWEADQQQALEKLLEPFPLIENPSQYRLALQQELQRVASGQQVSVTFFDWLSDAPLGVFNMHRGRLSLRLEGQASQVMQLHLILEQQFPHFMLRDVRASWRSALNPASKVELNLLIDVDYKIAEEA